MRVVVNIAVIFHNVSGFGNVEIWNIDNVACTLIYKNFKIVLDILNVKTTAVCAFISISGIVIYFNLAT